MSPSEAATSPQRVRVRVRLLLDEVFEDRHSEAHTIIQIRNMLCGNDIIMWNIPHVQSALRIFLILLSVPHDIIMD